MILIPLRGLAAITLATLAWAVASLQPAAAAGSAVINEFHYNSEDESSLEEFIELHNPGDAPYDLSGHSIADAVSYAFPAGTTIPAGGYLVVAQNPAVMLSRFGVAALGPWSSNLSSDGEEIELRNGANAKVDSVDYRAGFPWPTLADGGGPSAELINAGLDNSLGSSWRSAIAGASGQTFVAESAPGWRYYKGLTQAPTADASWRSRDYDDTAWSTGQAGFGYGNYDGHGTSLADMYNQYTTVYLRKSFAIDPGQVPGVLKLRVRVDDGCVIWINGTEVARLHVPAGELPFNATATNHDRVWEELTLANAGSYLIGGTNVIAVHAINTRIGSSDLSFDLRLTTADGSALLATPGAVNGNTRPLAQTPPAVEFVSHVPQQPTSGQPVVVTAKLADPDGVTGATLTYQLVDPGSYIRLTDAAYATSWTGLAMNDSGTGGDAAAGDGIWSVTVPGTFQTHRRLVRYRVTATDGLGNSQRFPYEEDEQPNFAWFCYDGIPAWTGALRPSAYNGFPATPAVTYPATVMDDMPAIHLIATATDVTNSQYVSAFNEVEMRGTVIQRGVVYDHIVFRNRGQGSIYVSGKNKWKINFNRARDFQAYDNWGRPYRETWNELPFNANASPWAAVHRGSAGIEEASSHRLFQMAGMLALNTQYFQLRVIDGAGEAGADQYSGDLWGLYMGFEPTEGNFIDERGLADGNLYSIEGNNGDKERQGPPPATADDSDWVAFREAVAQGGQTEAWYRAHVDLDSLYIFMAINRLIGNVDLRPGDNYRFYHRPGDDRWVIIPYDLDMMYIAAHHWGGTMDGVTVAGAPNVIRAILRHPALAREYRNRCREILSLVGSDASPTGGQIGQLLHEYAAMVNPPGQAHTWADIDAAMWNLHPRTSGGGGNAGQSSHKGNFFRASYLDGPRGGAGGTMQTGSWVRSLPDPDGDGFSDHEGLTQWFIDYATDTWPGGAWRRRAQTGYGTGSDGDPNRQKGYGYQYLKFEAENGGWGNANADPAGMPLHADFPAKPVITPTGTAATNNLAFSASAFSDPQGGSAAAMQWRIAEIRAPGIPGFVAGEPWRYEIESVWTSAELAGGGNFQFPLGVAEAGRRYRIRARVKDGDGNWSYWSDPVTLDAVAPPPYSLVHYWNFNSSSPAPSYSVLGGSESVTGTVLYSNGESFGALNARHGDPAGAHQRINDPLAAGTQVIYRLPTTGYRDILIQYETRRSGSGAGIQVIETSGDGGETWAPLTSLVIPDVGGSSIVPVVALDLSGVAAASDNPRFALRITFQQGAGGIVGNNRFDNFTVEGQPILGSFAAWRALHYPDPADQANAALSGPQADPGGSGISNLLRYALDLAPDDPVQGEAAGADADLPQLVTNGAIRVYRFRYHPAAGVVWRVQASVDLQDWSHVLFDSSVDPPPVVVDGWAEVPIPASLGGGAPDSGQFVRLQIREPAA